MFHILIILISGVVIGFIVKKLISASIPDTGHLMTGIVWAMMLFFGANIGQNPDIMADIPTLGLLGLIFGVASLIGSAFCCMLLDVRSKKPGSHIAKKDNSGKGLVSRLKAMLPSILTVTLFITGGVVAYCGVVPEAIDCSLWSELTLYLLIAVAGFSIGSKRGIRQMLRGMNVKILLIAPVSVAGTFIVGAVLGLLPFGYNAADSIAGVSGMGYYSMSSLLISELKVGTLGQAGALQLGAVALLANIIRELTALLLAPVIGRSMGTYALIGAAGVTSLDVCLPAIKNNCGDAAMLPALVNGLMLEVSCPFIVTFACAL